MNFSLLLYRSLLIFFLLTGNLVFAQNIKIVDHATGLPVSDVALFNKKREKSVISDQNGNADLGIFSETDSIFFQHPSFKRIVMLKSDLKQSGYSIGLEKEIRMLDEFVIAVNKWEHDKKEVPNKIKSISYEEVRFHNPQTTADLLATSNAVFLQKSQLGGGSPMIRGFAANSILLVVDGVRMNNAIYRSGNLQNVISLDPNTLQESEVIYGPGSVVYGSDALGGVISFYTLNPNLSSGHKVMVTGNVLTRYASANNEKTGHVDFNIGLKKWGFLTSLTYSDFADLSMGNVGNPSYQRLEYAGRYQNRDSVFVNRDPNLQKFSGYSQINFLQKIRFKPSGKLNMVYAFHFSTTSDIPRYDRLIQYDNDELRYAQWYYGPQQWMMHNFLIDAKPEWLLADHIKIVAAYQNFTESRHDRKIHETGLRHRTENADVLSMNVDLHKNILPSLTVYYGTELVYNNVRSKAVREDILSSQTTPAATRYPNGYNHYYALALYGSLKYQIKDNVVLNTGLRYNYVGLSSSIQDSSFYSFPYSVFSIRNGALNGSMGISYTPFSGSQLKINFASGFRAPNLDDAAKIFDSEPGRVMVPNQNLKPEYTYNVDLGWLQNVNDALYFELTGFYTLMKNAMVRRPFQFEGNDSIDYDGEMSQVTALVNASEATLYGVNINLKAVVTSGFYVSTDFTIMKGEDIDKNPLRHIPPFYGGLHFVYENPIIKGDFYLTYNGAISNANLAPEEQSKTHMYATDGNGLPYAPSWFTFNLKLSIHPSDILMISTGVENILNHRYRPYSSGIVASGRNIFLALRVSI